MPVFGEWPSKQKMCLKSSIHWLGNMYKVYSFKKYYNSINISIDVSHSLMSWLLVLVISLNLVISYLSMLYVLCLHFMY